MKTVLFYLYFWLLIFMTDLYFNKCYLLACYNRSEKKLNKAINHHFPYSAFWTCQIVLKGRWAGKEGASVSSLGSSLRDAASGACSFREVCKREEDSVPSLCLSWRAQAVSFMDSAVPLLGMTARVPDGLAADGCLPGGHKDPR